MSEPRMASRTPFAVEVKADEKYFWCACGLSGNQPFCDGSHKDTAFTPTAYTAPKDGTVYFCGCKRTGKAPLCDGTHNGL